MIVYCVKCLVQWELGLCDNKDKHAAEVAVAVSPIVEKGIDQDKVKVPARNARICTSYPALLRASPGC